MSTFHLKLIAVTLMVIDHLGAYFFPDLTLLRVFGRLSFPLFAWLIANGVTHTKNIKLYTLRLFIFALISQIPYMLINTMVIPNFLGLNIFFTLLLGLIAIQLIQQTQNKIVWFGLAIFFSIIGFLLKVDYEAAGVVSVIFFYLFYGKVLKMIVSQLLIFVSFYTVPILEQFLSNTVQFSEINMVALVQPLAVLSVVLISFYSGKEGSKTKYFFYVFYPLHLFIFYAIKRVWGF